MTSMVFHRRRTAVAATLATALLATGACRSGDPAPSPTGPPRTTPSRAVVTPSATVAPMDAGTKRLCTVVDRAVRRMLTDTIAGGADVAALATGFRRLSRTLEDTSTRATDPALGAAMKATAAQAAALARTPDPTKADDTAFQQAAATLERACAPAFPKPPTGSSGIAVGGTGTACLLPVTFEVAASWKPKAVTGEPGGVLDDLLRRGPLTVVCEVDAKPTGAIGFLRVWTGPADGGPRQALTAFLAGEDVRNPVHTDVAVAGRAGAEVVYDRVSAVTDDTRRERAFAVPTAGGVAVVELAGFDAGDDESLIAGYELAKRTMVVGP